MIKANVDFGDDADIAEQEEIQRIVALEEQKLNFAVERELEENPNDDSRTIAERVIEQLKDSPLEWSLNSLTVGIDQKRAKGD